MSSIRLLFAPENTGFAEKLASALQARGYDLRTDDAELASAALVVWSPAAASSATILSAARTALARRVLVPVAVGKTPPPPSFEHLWPMDLAGWTGREDDPRWRFVLDEIELATRRGVQFSLAPAANDTGARAAMNKVAAAMQQDQAPRADLRADTEIGAPVLAAPSRATSAPAPVAEEDFFAEAATPFSDEAPGPRIPRAAVAAAAAVAFAIVAVSIAIVTADRAPPRIAAAERPVIAFVQPKEDMAEEADATNGAPPLNDAAPVAALREGDVASATQGAATTAPPAHDAALAESQDIEPTPAAQPRTEQLAVPPIAARANSEKTPSAAPVAAGAPASIAALAAEAVAESDAADAAAVDADPIAELTWKATRDEAAVESASFGRYFRECVDCPDMAEIDAGSTASGAISVSRSFAIAVREITYRDWAKCAADGACPRIAAPGGASGAMLPVSAVSFADARRYADWLTQKTGARYRLPSEAEWEYAARGGGEGPYGLSRPLDPSVANYRGAQVFRGRTTPAGSFSPNPFGLYDTAGNVWEWTEDCWAEPGAEASSLCGARVLKGGAYDEPAERVRADARLGLPEGERRSNAGFRVVRER